MSDTAGTARERAERISAKDLIAIGFADVTNARRWLGFGELDAVDLAALLTGLSHAASPDVALQLIVRLIEQHPQIAERINGDPADAETMYRLLGASEALGEFLLRAPENLDLLDIRPQDRPGAEQPEALRRALLESVGADPEADTPVARLTGAEAQKALRTAYRRGLTRVAVRDVGALDPVEHMPAVGRQLADLAGAALEAALAVARAQAHERWDEALVEQVRLAVIGMGKCGARELNYISDVDVVYVVETRPAESGEVPDESTATEIATELAHVLAHTVMATGPEPALWEVDANLRPEGKDGPLVRTLDSHVRYYKRWAKSWEFQALLKARCVAGDRELGERYEDAIAPFIWSSAEREGFVESVQAMRRRVTENIPEADRDRQIKLGPGGLRDVEFTVQLLQLVHGRGDETVRTRATTDSLTALSSGGYIGRKDAEEFGRNYRWLRLLEHRIQLFRLRRTHLMPRDERELAVIARSVDGAREGSHPTAARLVEQWSALKRSVRSMHERIFYRPMLAALANAPADTTLTTDSARDRLAALGYQDTRAAMRHIEALSRGVSRRAEILRTLLPVLLDWLAEGVDPDAGLLNLRRVCESLGTTPWFLRLLRDSNAAAERLCHILSSSRYVSDLLEVSPEATAWLGDDSTLATRSLEDLGTEMRSQLSRHREPADAIRAVRQIRRREQLRIALADTSGVADVEATVRGLSDVDQATVMAALHLAQKEWETENVEPAPAHVLVIAMGRQGGREIGFGSDADVMYAYEPAEGAEPGAAQAAAESVLARMVKLLKQPCTPPIVAERVLEIDNDLRPEGRSGAKVRSVASYAEYYERWAETWEAQALTRARYMAGSEEVAHAFFRVADRHRYPAEFTDRQLVDIRRMKARVENERMPRGADPLRQVKLGRGGLSDVEWLVQLLQLQHAHEVPELRTTSTLPALHAAVAAELVGPEDASVLEHAWKLATDIRNGNVLRSGRASDSVPSRRADLEAVARWIGYEPGSATQLEEDYLRITRQSRSVFERLFYGR
ncbi:[glutamine synthetase] adenylyltransferase / [glutamine synthetase]-adenylyl-L-tyrosine phosphorylase [Kocuria rhizophila]|uniref:bifunctional [glutamine synthetase] adenylyltransferase/[glutamine synthetase]-adenylyl-L-tyrosine phosphorylase n=1 Tax=Kocuria rhizophila TaxID=72000 RepID=UPI00294A4A33|nr:bifunctional [glutamine synthetase] adenylyltransferase/[glutamine synthetase]-adenylyl-L-tyrosine phosphorylase [Kocuria rhizophila]MDV5999003.1 bifunctional [glutamine synthetase] adenylyltransferase/[glutamine synthetase]-adenylyl-L-tyrosine phosphorylase [Kocuria rhizophila]